jgi:hypothetical protein
VRLVEPPSPARISSGKTSKKPDGAQHDKDFWPIWAPLRAGLRKDQISRPSPHPHHGRRTHDHEATMTPRPEQIRGPFPNRPLRIVLALTGAAALLATGLLLGRARAQTPTRPSLTFAGTLTQNGSGAGPTTLTFTFRRSGASLCQPQVGVTPDADGAFTAEIPISGCPQDLFDGRDVTVDVTAGSVLVASNQPISPVPYAKYADRAGMVDTLADPDCPRGYVKQAQLPNPNNPMSVLCKNGVDEVVKVGTGQAAFWIDRYEATVNTLFDGTGVKNAVSVIPQNGQWALTGAGKPPGYALSVASELPATNITWFQAQAFCAFSGKRLPNGDEWLRTAVGTPDPTTPNSINGSCFTGGNSARRTGLGTICSSQWGAQDMIGNLWEWTTDWVTSIATTGPELAGAWPIGYGSDYSYWINSQAFLSPARNTAILPGAVLRGGAWYNGTNAGVFAYNPAPGPVLQDPAVGFRCVIPR